MAIKKNHVKPATRRHFIQHLSHAQKIQAIDHIDWHICLSFHDESPTNTQKILCHNNNEIHSIRLFIIIVRKRGLYCSFNRTNVYVPDSLFFVNRKRARRRRKRKQVLLRSQTLLQFYHPYPLTGCSFVCLSVCWLASIYSLIEFFYALLSKLDQKNVLHVKKIWLTTMVQRLLMTSYMCASRDDAAEETTFMVLLLPSSDRIFFVAATASLSL